jgi:hypothetical protein
MIKRYDTSIYKWIMGYWVNATTFKIVAVFDN